MSDLFVALGPLDVAAKAAEELRFASGTSITVGSQLNVSWAVSRNDSLSIWGPASDSDSDVTVLIGGRPMFEEEDWKRAADLPFEGGLAARLLLGQYLRNRQLEPRGLNGVFGVVVLDPERRLVSVVSDRLGVFPFYRSGNLPLAICSHPDVLARAASRVGRPHSVDWTTVAENLGFATAVHPHTYYGNMRQVDPATVTTFVLNGAEVEESSSCYWDEVFAADCEVSPRAELVQDLAVALRNAVRRRTAAILGPVGLLLSGGADSRVGLFGAANPSAVTCFTLYDEDNNELRASRELARIADARHVAIARASEHYATNVDRVVRVSGGMWSIADSHFLPVESVFNSTKLGTLLSGCYADYLLKGICYNRRPRTFLGRNIPLFAPGTFNHNFYHGHSQLSPHWGERVLLRQEERIPQCLQSGYGRDPRQVEALRLRPLSREANALARSSLMRLFSWDPFVVDNDILRVCSRIPWRAKLGENVYGQAVAAVTGPEANRVLNSNYHCPVDAPNLSKFFGFVGASARRKVQAAMGGFVARPWRLATDGSWPDYGYFVAHSERLPHLWDDPTRVERETFRDLLGFDPWSRTLAEWGRRDAGLLLRLVTVKTWLAQSGGG